MACSRVCPFRWRLLGLVREYVTSPKIRSSSPFPSLCIQHPLLHSIGHYNYRASRVVERLKIDTLLPHPPTLVGTVLGNHCWCRVPPKSYIFSPPLKLRHRLSSSSVIHSHQTSVLVRPARGTSYLNPLRLCLAVRRYRTQLLRCESD